MGMTFKPTVLSIEPGRELRWIGRLLMPGLFDGEHAFTIEPLDVERVRFIQSEKFTGLLVFLGTFMGVFRNTQTGFEEMNQALKERSERPPRSICYLRTSGPSLRAPLATKRTTAIPFESCSHPAFGEIALLPMSGRGGQHSLPQPSILRRNLHQLVVGYEVQ